MASTVPVSTGPDSAVPLWHAPWRSPAGQPGYARPVLLGLLLLAGVLYTWGIDHSSYHAFYADAARSMSENWKAFFYGSFDPGNSITLDKLPGFLWPQALSARVFGFHPWALVLPQVLEGMASLLVLHRLVSRWAGVDAALLACGVFLLTPVSVGLFRTAVEDPAFTLCLLLAAEAVQRASRDGRLGPLVVAGVWVGVGFQSKMLEAWAVLPALGVVYLVSAPGSLRRRVGRVGVAAVVMVAVSVSWMVVVGLVPAKDRPYVDGTTDNSAFSMVVGYNFLNRFSALGVSAGATGSVSGVQGDARAGGDAHARAGSGGGAVAGAGARAGARARARAVGGGEDGWGKMFGASLASQTGWLYPFAAVCAVCGVLWRRGRPRTDGVRAGFLLWGVWLGTFFLVFSAGSVGDHTYYMGVIAVPVAALTGGGTVVMWRAYRSGGRRGWVLPGALGVTAAWGVCLAGEFGGFLPWLAGVVGALGAVGVALLVVGRSGGGGSAGVGGPSGLSGPAGAGGRAGLGGRLTLAGLATGLAAVLIAPGAWVAQVFNPAYRSTGMGAVGPTRAGGGRGTVARAVSDGVFASAGGRAGRSWWAGGAGDIGVRAGGFGQDGSGGLGGDGAGGFGRTGFGVGAFRGGVGSSGELTVSQRELLAYARAHQGSASYVFATSDWTTASPYILATGAHILPFGGFSGRVPFPTQAGFKRLVESGGVKYVLVGADRGMGGSKTGATGARSTTAAEITQWVRSTCTEVPATEYGGADGTGTLYHCGT
ncbi:glycosyltransferase family 39 protein [Streptomyces roseirectus]|uniref:Glycosyltransferase family 39 protein n=1 Tax=Streptomyces roseirectus TaxID=2768066 RepID=A0A7H0I7Q2_9ACTN|nr:glycosyltransferase family 39 protein [Streptomyces roseirectus]QNP68818.1 glycosyltransferase family 39 protein [Streptomyces roseirectus]